MKREHTAYFEYFVKEHEGRWNWMVRIIGHAENSGILKVETGSADTKELAREVAQKKANELLENYRVMA